MADSQENAEVRMAAQPFYQQPNVETIAIPAGGTTVPLGIEQVRNPLLGIGGAYGSWGDCYDNETLPALVEKRLGEPLDSASKMELAALGFTHRQHVPDLTPEQHAEVEINVGTHFLQRAMQACGWKPEEVDAVIIGMSGPLTTDYTERIARAAGIAERALKVSVHKACDGSVGGLHLALNPYLEAQRQLGHNLAEELRGKKVLVGGIEGLSRFMGASRDINALQLFANAAGVIGIIPGMTLKFLTGKSHEVFDQDGVLSAHMYYPHSRVRHDDRTNIEVYQEGQSVRVAGLMNEPADGRPVAMQGLMGMVKLFVRSGVQVVQEVYTDYQKYLENSARQGKEIAVALFHHANYKINKLMEKNLIKEGIHFPMPWLLSEFGNVSAASNMIAFLRQLPKLMPGDHVLIVGFGAGTYYDAMVVELP